MSRESLSTPQGMAEAIRRYLALLREQADPEEVRLGRLAHSLDALVVIYHGLPDTQPDPDVDAPPVEYQELERLASASFPELGFYCDVVSTPAQCFYCQPAKNRDSIYFLRPCVLLPSL